MSKSMIYMIFFFLLTSCSQEKEIIHIGLLNPPHSLKSWEIRDGASTIIGHQIHRGLLYRNPITGILEGYAAKSWSISKDLKVIHFKLKKDIKFHDQTHLSCFSIKKSFQRLIKGHTREAQKFPQGTTFECNIPKSTFSIKLPYIPGNFLTYLSSVNSAIVKDDGITGIGPYKINTRAKKIISLEKVDQSKRWLIFHIKDYKTLISDFKNKKIDDLLYLGLFKELNIPCKKIESLTPTSFWFSINSKTWAFQNIENRRALKVLIEKALNHSDFFSKEYKIKTLIPWGILGHNESNLNPPQLKMKDAKVKLLEKVKSYGKIRVTLRLIHQENSDWLKLFHKIDPKNEIFNIEFLSNKKFFQEYYKKNLSFFVIGANIKLDDPFEILSLFRHNDRFNPAQVKEFDIDKLYQKSSQATNIEDIKQLALKANYIILNRAYAIPLYTKKLLGCVQENIEGIQIGTLGPLQIDYSQVRKR